MGAPCSFIRKLLGSDGAAQLGPSSSAADSGQSHVHTMGENMAYTSGPFTAFNTKVIIVTACLLLILIFALVINIFTRWFLRRLLSSPSSTNASSLIGLNKGHLNSLPTTTYNMFPCPLSPTNQQVDPLATLSTPSQCPICLVDFKHGERIRVLPKCEHGFHVSCIDPWLLKHASCPTCRGDLMDSIIKT